MTIYFTFAEAGRIFKRDLDKTRHEIFAELRKNWRRKKCYSILFFQQVSTVYFDDMHFSAYNGFRILDKGDVNTIVENVNPEYFDEKIHDPYDSALKGMDVQSDGFNRFSIGDIESI